MSAKVLRTFALGGRWTAAARPAGERGLPQAPNRFGVPVSGALRARAFGAGAPGSLDFAEKERLVTAEMRASRIDLGRPSGIDRFGDWRAA